MWLLIPPDEFGQDANIVGGSLRLRVPCHQAGQCGSSRSCHRAARTCSTNHIPLACLHWLQACTVALNYVQMQVHNKRPRLPSGYDTSDHLTVYIAFKHAMLP